MTVKTIQAKSLPLREGFAYAGTEKAPHPPTMATAYKRAEGTITIALVKGGVVEVRSTERVRYSTSPVADGATYLRWCRKCEEPHLLRVGTDKAATLYCDARTKAIAKEKEAGTYVSREQREEAERAAMVERVTARLTNRPAPTREQMIAATLANVARDLGSDSPRFATLAAMYHLSLDDARRLAAPVLDRRNERDASANVAA